MARINNIFTKLLEQRFGTELQQSVGGIVTSDAIAIYELDKELINYQQIDYFDDVNFGASSSFFLGRTYNLLRKDNALYNSENFVIRSNEIDVTDYIKATIKRITVNLNTTWNCSAPPLELNFKIGYIKAPDQFIPGKYTGAYTADTYNQNVIPLYEELYTIGSTANISIVKTFDINDSLSFMGKENKFLNTNIDRKLFSLVISIDRETIDIVQASNQLSINAEVELIQGFL